MYRRDEGCRNERAVRLKAGRDLRTTFLAVALKTAREDFVMTLKEKSTRRSPLKQKSLVGKADQVIPGWLGSL